MYMGIYLTAYPLLCTSIQIYCHITVAWTKVCNHKLNLFFSLALHNISSLKQSFKFQPVFSSYFQLSTTPLSLYYLSVQAAVASVMPQQDYPQTPQDVVSHPTQESSYTSQGSGYAL